jgi:ribosome-associated protein
MIEITPTLRLDENELQMDFIHASGPGGQNVNKVATAVQLRFNAAASPSLTEDVRLRLMALARGRITENGILIIEARRQRTQAANRQDAIERLVELLRRAAEKPRVRHKTRPTLASKEKRLAIKRRRSVTKDLRRSKAGEEE